MTDNDIEKFVAMLCSEDLSNVLLAIEMFEPLNHYDKEAVADAFLNRMSGEIINMYMVADSHTTFGVWKVISFEDPINHTAFGFAFEIQWSYWVEMAIWDGVLKESAQMSGKGNFHAVGYKDVINDGRVFIDARVHEGYNSFFRCMEFFFESIAPIIRNYLNDNT